MPDTPYVTFLKSLSICGAAIDSAATRKDAADSWQNCKRADWLIFLAGKTSVNDPVTIKRTAVQIARSVVALSPDPRSAAAVTAAEAWLANPSETTLEAARTAAAAARTAENALQAAGETTKAFAARAASWAAWCICVPQLAEAARAVVWSAHHADPNTDHCAILRGALKQPWTEGGTGTTS